MIMQFYQTIKSYYLALVAIVILAMTAQSAWAWNGSGTSSSPYQITSTSDLLQLANDVYDGNTYSGKYFKLMNDLVFTTSNNWNGISPTFASIGNDTNPFEGTFDGDNHTLTGVYIYRAWNNKNDLYQGLFGVIGSGGVVKNIILNNSKIAASNYSGAIAGENRGTITNCHVTSSVIVSPQRDYVNNIGWESCYVGGIAGNNASGATISNCSSSAKIWTHEITTSNSSGDAWTSRYGGIAGVNAGSLTNCFALGVNTGIIKSGYGAITGYSNGTLANNYYADCYIVGQSSSAGTTTSDGQVDITTNDGAVKANIITLSDYTTTSSDKVFTIPAHKELNEGSLVSVKAVNYNLAKVGTTVTLGHTEHSTDSYFFTNYSVKDAGNADVTVSNGNTFTMPDKNVTATANFTDFEWSGSGNSVSDPYLITSPEQLILLARRVNNGTGPKNAGYEVYYGKFFKVTKDITFTTSTAWDNASSTENNYTAIGGVRVGNTRYEFAGTFDGGGKTIKGIRIYQPDSHDQGLFGYITSEAVVKNVSLSETRIMGKYFASGIVGSNRGTVINCSVGGNVSIVGNKYEHKYHGGVVGDNYGTVEGCRSLAKLTYNDESSVFWGGIAGRNSGTLKNNLAYNSTVNAPTSGAIVGSQEGGTLISNYYYNCTINGASNASNVGIVYENNNMYKLSDVDDACKAVQIGASNNAITFQPTGEATTYDVSKITVYEGNNVLKFLILFFSGDTKTVNFGLSHSNATGNVVKYYDTNGNELISSDDNTYTYTMTNKALSISAKLIPDWAQKNSGDNEGDAYVISTAEQLDLLSERVNAGNSYANKFFKLGDNLTYTKATTNNFTPIGTESHPFGGNFDGNKKTISGINISLGTTDNVGLFGYASDATIKNLKLDDSTINGRLYVGAILGCGYSVSNTTTIENCLVTSSVTVSGQSDVVGGIVGITATVRGCVCAASVSGTSVIGGIIGDGNNSTVTNCLYTGSSITGYNKGAIAGNKNNGNFTYNYYTGNPGCSGTYQGDADGARKAVEITSTSTAVSISPTGSYAEDYTVSGIKTFTGSTAIQYADGNNTKFYAGATESVNFDITYNAPYVGFSLTGYTDGNEPATSLAHVSGNTWKLVMPATTVDITPAGSDLWGEQFNGRDGSAEHPYLITTTEGLDLLAKKVNGIDGYSANTFDGTYFELGNDITYDKTKDNNYTAIGIYYTKNDHPSFGGIFDGKGHKVSGIRINKDEDYQGLFGYIRDGQVKNVTIANTTVTTGRGNEQVGAIAGQNYNGIIENCHVLGDVYINGGGFVGGIAGYSDQGSVRGCTSRAHVSGTLDVGGILGVGSTTLQNCLVIDAVINGSDKTGIITGRGYSTNGNNRYTGGTTLNGGSPIGHGVGSGDKDGAATIAYEFPAATYAMGAAVSTYAEDTDYEGITAYENGLAYNGKFYSPSPWGGRGTDYDPYVIYNIAGMDKLASEVNGGNDYDGTYFVLGADITYDKTKVNNYTPIGNGKWFYGTFDGQGHTISGIRISDTNSDTGLNKAIFGMVTGTVKNLVVSDCSIEAYNTIGGIVAILSLGSTIENCHVGNDVTLTGHSYIGGIAAENEGGTIKGCTSAATIRGTKDGDAFSLGGIVGFVPERMGVSPTLTDNLFTGTINGDLWQYIGAIVGWNNNNSTNFTNNYHTCSGMGGVGSAGSATGSDEDGAFRAVSSTTKPSGFGEVTTTYGKDDYIGITAYQYGLCYDGQYYEKDPNVVIWSGRGTAEKPYVIRTTAELDLLATRVNNGNEYKNTYFVLGADIAYDGSVENNYTPIGDNTHPFSGTFDGQGHTISGIRISDTNGITGEDKAIFGMVDGTVKNLVVSDCCIEAYNTIGGIVATLQSGTIENCHVLSDVTLSGNAYVGGIAARNDGGTIKGCTCAATIMGTEANEWNAEWLGGIACSVTENGGIPTLTDNLFTGTISGDLLDYIGAIVGMDNCDETILTNNYHTCSDMGGVGNEGSATGSDVDGATIAYELPEANAAMGAPGSTYAEGTDYEGITVFENGLVYNGQFYSPSPWSGNGTEDDPYIIYTPEGLDQLASRVNSGNDYNGKFFALGADITYDKTVLTLDLDGEEGLDSNFPGIGIDNENQNPFVGSLDGRGHTISGIVINRPNYQYVGLFGYAIGEYIKNLTLANSDITGKDYVGGIVGSASHSANIENCHVTSDVTVSGQFNVGGIVGVHSTIQGCTSAATVSGSEYVGGILGHGTNSTVRDCLYLGNSVTATSNRSVGAIVGNYEGTMDNNYHTYYGHGGVGSNGSATGDDVSGALFAVSATKPNAIMGAPTAVYGEDDYIGITAYSPNGLYYNDRYYWPGDFAEIDIYDDDINEENIVDNNGKIVNVLLAGRTFRKDGKWSTIVLPFDVDLNDPASPLYGATIRTLTDENNEIAINGTMLNLTFGEKQHEDNVDNTLMAGVPYLIRWNRPDGYEGNESMYDIENPLFMGVTIKNECFDLWSDYGVFGFVGNYNCMRDVVNSWGVYFDILLLGDDNHLHYATPEESLGACRAFFIIDRNQIGDSNFRLTNYIFDLGNGEMLSGTFPSIVQPVQPGDANGDGSISVTDIAVVVNCILQLDNNGGFSPDGADANGDGQVTVTDIGVIVDKILGAHPQPLPKGGEPQ